MIERRVIRFDHELLAGLELPCFEATGPDDGPHVCLLGGIHGGEYSSIAAVVRFMNALDANALAGRITAVPIVSMPSFRARSAFVVPQDGKNLNRCFPGSYDGTFSDVLARHVFDELIAPSDAMLDLHGGDMVEDLEPFALYDESPVEDEARALAIAFDLPYVVRSVPADAPISGTTTAAAAAVGMPAAIAEVGGRGLLEEDAVQRHLRGLENALRCLGMLPGDPAPPRADMRSVGRFVWLRCEDAGWWEADVRAGDVVDAGASLGAIRNLFGDVEERIAAPADGVVLFVTTSPAVEADGLLVGLGVEIADIGPE
jgi:predicted deacylase